MTITIPNYFIDNQEPTLIALNRELFIESISGHQQRVLIRNTMHGVTLITKGSKEVKLGKKSFQIEKLQAVFFAQGNYFSNQNSQEYQAITIFFSDSFVVDFVKKYQIRSKEKPHKIVLLNYANSHNILNLINSISLTKGNATHKQKELLTLKTELLFLEFYEAYPQQMEQFFQHIVQTSNERMRYILEENIDILEKVSDMQKLMRMSPSHFKKSSINYLKYHLKNG